MATGKIPVAGVMAFDERGPFSVNWQAFHIFLKIMNLKFIANYLKKSTVTDYSLELLLALVIVFMCFYCVDKR